MVKIKIYYRSLYTITLILSLSVLSLPDISYTQWRTIGPVDKFEITNDGISVFANPAVMRISVIAPDIIRIRLAKDGLFSPDSSWAVVGSKLGDQTFEIKELGSEIYLTTAALTCKITKKPCRVSFYDSVGTLLNQDDRSKGISWSGSEIVNWKTMPIDEYYFGFGEKSGGLQKKGKALCMWNCDIPAYKADTDPLYQTIPFFYGLRDGRSYGIFFDNTYYSFFNMGKEHPGQYSFGASDGEMNYYFIYGPKPNGVIEKFSRLVGKTPLPPKWAIGYQQCRWSYYPESRVREIASAFRAKNIPCDAIYLDIHYMDAYKCFTWDSERFPDPKRLSADLTHDGFKIVVIVDPGIKNEPGYWVYDEGIKNDHFVKYDNGNYFTGKVWPGDCVFPDFTAQRSRDWWGSLYKGLIGSGIKGFWNDMNEPSVFDGPNKTFALNVMHDDRGTISDHRKNHNIYGMQMARGTYEGAIKIRPDERPFVLTRANYAGGNRYAAAWTGDNISSWEHLEMAVPMCLNLSISGQPFVGTDIGGFVGSPSGELYARWLQLGIFTPLMRTHTEYGSKDQEPWSFGEMYEKINRESIGLRYRLLPYLYTQFYKASTDGTPIMRPLFFDYPDDPVTYGSDTEFLFGDAFLVAPVLWEGRTHREVRLPGGDWYDYHTGEKITGPKFITVDAPIDIIPLFVKAGSIITAQQLVQYSDEAPIDTLTLDIYPAPGASGVLYEDDGISYQFQRGKHSIRHISMASSQIGYELTLADPEGYYTPPPRTVKIIVHDVQNKPSSVDVDGEKTDDAVWSYNTLKKTVELNIGDRFVKQKIVIGK